MIKDTYHITPQTLAILPAKLMDVDTIVIEKAQKLHVRRTPLQIIEDACLYYGASYAGRRQAVMHRMNFHQKVPIPISIYKELYFFPTHSPTHIDNSWIAGHQITRMMKHPDDCSRSIVQFIGGQTLSLNISRHILTKQAQRTFACVYKFREIVDKWQDLG